MVQLLSYIYINIQKVHLLFLEHWRNYKNSALTTPSITFKLPRWLWTPSSDVSLVSLWGKVDTLSDYLNCYTRQCALTTFTTMTTVTLRRESCREKELTVDFPESLIHQYSDNVRNISYSCRLLSLKWEPGSNNLLRSKSCLIHSRHHSQEFHPDVRRLIKEASKSAGPHHGSEKKLLSAKRWQHLV